MRELKAFTLVELLVVIAIIALLISILAPSLGSVKELAKVTICSTNLRGAAQAIVMYGNSNKSLIPPNDPGASSLGAMYSPDSAWKAERCITWKSETQVDYYQGLGILYQGGQAANANLFYCPSRTYTTPPDADNPYYYSRAFWPQKWDERGIPDGAGGIWRHRTGYLIEPIQTDKQFKADQMWGTYPVQIYSMNKMDASNILVMDLLMNWSDGSYTEIGTIHARPSPSWNLAFLDTHVERKESATAYNLCKTVDIGNGWVGFAQVVKKIAN